MEHAHKNASILQLHLGESARIASYMEDNAQHTINAFKNSAESWIESLGVKVDSDLLAHFFNLVQLIYGFPRHMSQHNGGFVISKTKLDEYCS